MRQIFKKGQKGFTLVELMVVMAIIAVLAAIVIPPVTGTKQVSSDSQVKQDASAVSTAVSKFNADQNLAQNIATATTGVLGETTTAQVTSNKWPEQGISAAYATEFPVAVGTAANSVSSVTIKDKDGTTVYATGNSTASMDDFVAAYNAINLTTLTTSGYLQQSPNGADAKFSTSKAYHNYLWLVKKVKVDTDATAGRVVEVYSLTTVTTVTADALIYQRVY